MGNDKSGHATLLKKVVKSLSGGCDDNKEMKIAGNCELLPSQSIIAEIIELCRSVLFPGVFATERPESISREYFTGIKCARLLSLLEGQIVIDTSSSFSTSTAHEAAMKFIAQLPAIRDILAGDIEAAYLGDPAAESTTEVMICYPGFRAILNYRIAHLLYILGAKLLARMICEKAHSETGIDIHPGAKIGKRFSIDHGTGVVIGATAEIGDGVKLYQGVTLGAKSFNLDENQNPVKGIPRHPKLGNNVIVYSNASILGRVKIGDNAVIGGNIWVDEDVAAGERLIQARPDNVLRIPAKKKRNKI